MRIRGFLLAVTVLLAGTACAREVVGAPTADQAPPTPESSAAPESTIPECTGCDEETADAALKNPVVAQPKQVDNPPACEDVLPQSTITRVIGTTTQPRASASTDQCHAEWRSADLSQLGLLWVRFQGPNRVRSATITDFEGSTRFEDEDPVDTECEAGIAINDELRKDEHGSWLVLRVKTDEGAVPSCEVANQLLDIAFDNLPDA